MYFLQLGGVTQDSWSLQGTLESRVQEHTRSSLLQRLAQRSKVFLVFLWLFVREFPLIQPVLVHVPRVGDTSS